MNPDGPRVPYVQSVGSLDVPPPYHFPGVTVNAFVWEAQMSAVQDYCDRFLNLGTPEERGFTYKPAPFWPYATLLFLDYPVMISSNPAPQDMGEVPYGDRGIVSQTEVLVSLPVVRYGLGADRLVTESELECALPFIVVGNPMSAVCGREMLGLGKLLAEIKTGEGRYPDSFLGTVDLPGWSEMRTGVEQQMLRFITAETGPALPSFRTSNPARSLATLLQSREAGWMMDGMASLSNLVDSASAGLIPTTMRTVGLKQYRDAHDTGRAVYQALVTCRSRYSNLRDFRFYDEKDAVITANCEGSFQEILEVFLDVGSVPTGTRLHTRPAAAFRFMADIDFDSTRVIHRFAVDGPPGHPPTPAQSDLTARWFRPLKGLFTAEPRR